MSDFLDFRRAVERRMDAFMVGRRSITRAEFAAELDHNISYEAAHGKSQQSEQSKESVRESMERKFSRQLVNF